jgi:hypothetical protein
MRRGSNKAPNYNTQITNKFQYPMFKMFVRRRRIKFWSLGFVWDLSFGIWDLNNFYSAKGRCEQMRPHYRWKPGRTSSGIGSGRFRD